jgi:hypothetical protein
VTTCITWIYIKRILILPTEYIVFCMIPTINVVTETHFLSSEIGTQFLNIICTNFVIQTIYLSVNWIRLQQSSIILWKAEQVFTLQKKPRIVEMAINWSNKGCFRRQQSSVQRIWRVEFLKINCAVVKYFTFRRFRLNLRPVFQHKSFSPLH